MDMICHLFQKNEEVLVNYEYDMPVIVIIISDGQ